MILSVITHIEICVPGGEIVTDKCFLGEIGVKCVERVAIIRYIDTRFCRESAVESKKKGCIRFGSNGICVSFHGVDIKSHVLII